MTTSLDWSELVNAVRDDSYRDFVDERLRQLLRLSVKIEGPNAISHAQIANASALLRWELDSRASAVRHRTALWIGLSSLILSFGSLAVAVIALVCSLSR